MAATPAVFEIAADRLAQLYPELRCDGCGVLLTRSPDAIWVKAGCGYFCPACQADGRDLICRMSVPAGTRTPSE